MEDILFNELAGILSKNQKNLFHEVNTWKRKENLVIYMYMITSSVTPELWLAIAPVHPICQLAYQLASNKYVHIKWVQVPLRVRCNKIMQQIWWNKGSILLDLNMPKRKNWNETKINTAIQNRAIKNINRK